MSKIALRRLGNQDTLVSALGLGCWQFSEGRGMVGRFWPTMTKDVIHNIVATSIAGGMNWFDTAAVYGNGASEQALADALIHANVPPGEVMVSTKWWLLLKRAPHLKRTFHLRQDALAPFPVDLYQVHQPYSLSSIKRQMDIMATLVESRAIQHVGVSNFSPRQMLAAHKALSRRGIHLVSNQVKYNLLDRRIEHNGLIQLAKDLDVTIIAYSPLEQGILTGKFHKNPHLIQESSGPRKYLSRFREHGLKLTQPLIAALERIAWRYQATASQIALNWLIHANGDTIIAIPGASSVEQARQNVGALDFVLDDTDITELSEVSKSIGKRI